MEEVITTARLFDNLVNGAPYDVWCGVAGYNTLPYFSDMGELELPHVVGFANSYREGYEVAGNIEKVRRQLDIAPTGAIVIIPDYYGSNFCGESHYTKVDHDRWVEKYFSFER